MSRDTMTTKGPVRFCVFLVLIGGILWLTAMAKADSHGERELVVVCDTNADCANGQTCDPAKGRCYVPTPSEPPEQ